MASRSSSADPATRPIQRVFSRRTGRPLSSSRKAALARLPEFLIPRDMLTERSDITAVSLFPRAPNAPTWLEFGFGSGEHLLARIAQNPTSNFIGIEPYINGLSNFLNALKKITYPNLRLFDDDGMRIIRSLAPASLDGVYLLNPDPWPKARHHKRRIVNAENLNDFARVLKPGGLFVTSTDVDDLAAWTYDHFSAHPAFAETPETRANPHTPPAGWPLITRYMDKGVKEGRRETYMIFERVKA